MRKIIILILCVFSIQLSAQNIQLNHGKQTRIFAEQTFANENTMFYGYIESSYNAGSYGQLILEKKYWSIPIFAHAEYRTYFDGSHIWIGGGSYSIYSEHGFISIQALYRYDGVSNPQLSTMYNYDFGRIDIYGYADLWGTQRLNFYNENRLYVKLVDNISIGAIVDLSFFGEFSAVPYIGIRYKF